MAETSPAHQQYPNLNPYGSANGNGSVNGTVESVKNTAQSITNGPMADKARSEAATTKNEFSNLASSRTAPNTQTATGQTLTHYHSFFYNLLSWENPRATALSYALIATFIIAGRYVPLVRYILKGMYMVLGITAAAEIVGRLALGEGFATKIRPKRYYTIPRETLESMMEDLTELANFFVIEFQRVVFAENIGVTVGAFTTALITYFLIKVTPAWGLALLFTTLGYFVPLAYMQNQEFIDTHLSNAQDLVSQQTVQLRDMAAEHTSKARQMSESAFKDYSAKAQEMIGGAKKTAVEKGYVSSETAAKVPGDGIKQEQDFPTAPQTEPTRDAGIDQITAKQEDDKVPMLS